MNNNDIDSSENQISDNTQKSNNGDTLFNKAPFIPLRDIVIFPGSTVSFYIGRTETVASATVSIDKYHNYVFIGTQKDPENDNPQIDDVYPIGVIAKIINLKTNKESNICELTVKSLFRATVFSASKEENVCFVQSTKVEDSNINYDDPELKALLSRLIKDFGKYTKIQHKSIVSMNGLFEKMKNIDEIEILINMLSNEINMPIQTKLSILQETNTLKRIEMLDAVFLDGIEIEQLGNNVINKIKEKNEKQNKEFFITQQIKEFQKELSTITDKTDTLYENEEKFAEFVEKSSMNKSAKEKALLEAKRLRSIPSMSPDAGILQTYLEWLINMPWKNKSQEILDYTKSEEILNSQHYGLKTVKERVLEFIAVRNLNSSIRGPVLCFVGPPGVGKTSLSRSIAQALGREFIRISLGGVRDEAEIRGHRRTYLGAMPGKIIQSMKKAKTSNPVFLLDEIDKMTSDMRGDPASALLEVLDPEQNSEFIDHYLEVPYDLSDVMFITTANSLQGIPYPLRDRMEIIQIGSYTEKEKVNIARNFLINREKKENGIENLNLSITLDGILTIIRYYTFEAGVRNLQRSIGTICRKVAQKIVKNEIDKNDEIIIDKKNVIKYLGKKKITKAKVEKKLTVGVSHGLAWSELGGSLLPIECVIYPGNGKVVLTGKLGDVMKESVQAAYSYIRSKAHIYNLKFKDFYKKYDVHVHFPEGATPKDGPSGGIAISCAILSALTKVAMNCSIAMTGEITLTGKVLPIGGLKEKVLAADQNGKKIVIIPQENKKDLVDIPKSVRKKIDFKTVKKVSEVFSIAFSDKIYAKKTENDTNTETTN